MVLELLTGLSTLLKKVRAKPDLFQVSLVRILGQNLLDCHLPLGGLVDAQPDDAESPTAKQAHSLEVFGESFTELAVLVGSEVGPNIKGVLILVAFIDFKGLLLGVLRLIDVVVSLLEAASLLL